MDEVTVKFRKERETKRKIVFEEIPESGQAEAVGSLYLMKHISEQLGSPQHIELSVRVPNGN